MGEARLTLQGLRQRLVPAILSPAARQGAVMFVALSAVGAANYLYHVLMGRLLGPGEYATFAALIAAFTILAVPAQVVQTVTAHYTAKFKASEDWTQIATFVLSTVKIVLVSSLAVAFATIAGSGLISSFLQISSPLPAVIMGAMIVPSVLLLVNIGALQGLQKFGFLGASMIGNSLLRLVAGVALVLLGFQASGALGAGFISASVLFFLTLVPLWSILRRKEKQPSLKFRAVHSYSTGTALGLVCFALLSNMDMMVVKHFFAPAEAGQYAAASTLGKVVLHLPAAVALVMFPKSTQEYARGGNTAHILRRSLVAVGILLAPVLLAYWLFPSLVVEIFFGSAFLPAIPILGGVALAMAFYAFLNVLLLYYISIQRWSFVVLLAAGTASQGVSLFLFHSSLSQVILMLILNGAALVTLSELLRRSTWGKRHLLPLPPQNAPSKASKGL